MKDLPKTGFELHEDNPAAKIFYGRLPLVHGFSWVFFNKGSLTQHLIHQVKYRKNLDLGRWLGGLMAASLMATPLYNDVDVLVPLPLNKKKLAKRGFNQAKLLCEGMSAVWNKTIEPVAVVRTRYTETQTK
jgi:predicted amidophosphoribosyltransferase